MFLVRALLLSLVPAMCWAQTPSEKAEAFLTQVAAGQPEEALDKIFARSGLAELKPQALLTMKSQMKAAMGVYGKAIGFETISETDFSPSLKRLTYLQKFEMYPVVCEMYFYKATDTWVLNNILFNDQLAPVLGAR